MATDIATLGIKVDASTVDQAGEKLDNFANKGAKAEQQTDKLKSATEELASRVNALKASVDPMGYAQDKVNAEMAEASALYKSGAISASEYAQAQLVLNARSEAFAAKQSVMNAHLVQGAGAARLTTQEALNLSRQFADIGVTAAMGMNPLMILIQQGPQIADIMRTSGLSIKDVGIELLKTLGIVRTVTAANDNQAVSAVAVTAANTALATSNTAVAASASGAAVDETQLAFSFIASTEAAIANTVAEAENAIANKAVEETAEAAAKAETQLSFAFMQSAGAAQASAAASAEAAVANAAAGVSSRGAGQAAQGAATAATGATRAFAGMGAAGAEAGAASTVALAPLGVALAAIVAVLAVVTAGFAIFSRVVSKDVGDVTRGMGLTEKQLDRIKEKGVSTTVTLGDTVKAFFQVAGERLYKAFEGPLKWLQDMASTVYNWVVGKASWAIKEMVGLWFGAYRAIQATWSMLPGAIGDIAISTANNVISAIEDMVNGAIDRINKLAQMANGILPEGMQIGQLGNVSMGRFGNPYEGQAAATARAGAGAFQRGQAEGRGAVSDFYNDVRNQARDNRRDALRDAAGDPEAGSRGRGRQGQSEAEREYERRVKEAQDFAKALRDETAEIGKNAIEVKRMAAERAAALAPTQALRNEIMQAQAAWEQATANEALRQLTQELRDQADAIDFENSLIGKNNEEREVMLAQREIDLRLRDLERQGILITNDLIEEETNRILANARARGQRQDVADNARNAADEMRRMNDAVREAANSFGELFGTAGEGFAQLINVMTDYRDRQLEAEAMVAEARARYGEESIEAHRAEREAAEEMARAQIDYYGDMIGAAKRMFKEKSTGWKVLEAVEKAYRAYQMVSLVLEAIGVTKSIALDSAKTASSVTNSGIRASADGVAAIAKAIASLPFPLNLVAGAATAAALVAFGVKLIGGGKGGGASAAAEKESKSPTYSGPVDEYGAPTSSYSVLKPGRTVVGSNDNGQAAVAPGMAAGASSGMGGMQVNSTLTIQGNVDSDMLPQVQKMFEENNRVVIQQARQVVNEDIAARAGRQRIGGAG